MNRMERREAAAKAAAAAAASEAGRVLQQQQQASKTELEAKEEPAKDNAPRPTITKREMPRDQIMEEIRARREEQAKEEPPKYEPDPEPKAEPKPESKPEAKPEPEPVKVEAQDTVEGAQAEPEKPEPVKIETVRVKVDGEEFDAPKADVEAAGGISLYQRDKASDNRLKKANEALAEARRVQAEIAKMTAKPAEPQVTDDQFIASKMDAIRFGTSEESAAAFREVLARQNKPINPQQIIEQATQRIRHDQAVEAFDKEFQDVVSNPLLLKLTYTLRNERLQQMQQTPPQGPVDWGNFYRTIGNEVRSLVGKPSQNAPTPAKADGTTSQPDKEARKASIVNLPTAAARAELPKEEKPETREDALKRMRASRAFING